MKVKEAMHKGVDWVDPDTPVTDLAKLIRQHDIGAIPISNTLSLFIAVNAAPLPSSRSETETRWLSYAHSRCRTMSRGNVTA